MVSGRSDSLKYLRMIAVVASWAALMWFGGQKHATTEVSTLPPDTRVTVGPSGTADQSDTDTFKVISITDGDTADILKDGKPLRLRFAGIDTPEKGQPFGNTAKQVLSDRIGGKFVRVVIREVDRYGRAIADVYDDQGHVNLWLVQQGLAWHYTAYSDDIGLAAAERDAKASSRGLWSDKRHVAPWNWRKLSKVERDGLR